MALWVYFDILTWQLQQFEVHLKLTGILAYCFRVNLLLWWCNMSCISPCDIHLASRGTLGWYHYVSYQWIRPHTQLANDAYIVSKTNCILFYLLLLPLHQSFCTRILILPQPTGRVWIMCCSKTGPLFATQQDSEKLGNEAGRSGEVKVERRRGKGVRLRSV